MKRSPLLLLLVPPALVGCRSAAAAEGGAPRLVATATLVGRPDHPEDWQYVVRGAINGRPFGIVLDYGSNGTAVADRTLDSLHIPQPYASATRVRTVVVRPGVRPEIDSTADVITQTGDTIKMYWGSFEPVVLDSLRLGTSLQRHVYVGTPLAWASYGIDALVGRDVLSQFDLEFDGPRKTVRLYERSAPDSTAPAPRWLPPGLTAADCVRATVVGPKPIPEIPPGDTAGVSAAEKQRALDDMVAARRLLGQTELKFPVVVDGHRIDATFDSGTSDAILNWPAARAVGLAPGSPRVRPDSTSPEWTSEASGVALRLGRQTLPAPRVWIGTQKFGNPIDQTTPDMLLGLRQFSDRVLFMSHSTGQVCVGR